MAGERRLRMLSLLVRHGATVLETMRLCQVCADVTGTSGAGVMLMSGDVPHGSLGATDAVSARLEELEYSLGEGPCVDAYEEDSAVLEPDLAEPAVPRWLAFSGPALAVGARAVFASRCTSGRCGSEP